MLRSQQTPGTHPSYSSHTTRGNTGTHTHKLPYPDSAVTKRPPTTVSVSAPFSLARHWCRHWQTAALTPAVTWGPRDDDTSPSVTRLSCQLSHSKECLPPPPHSGVVSPAVYDAINITSSGWFRSPLTCLQGEIFTTSHRSWKKIFDIVNHGAEQGLDVQESVVSDCQNPSFSLFLFFLLSLSHYTTYQREPYLCRLSITGLLRPSWSLKFTLCSSWRSIWPRARWELLDSRRNKERHSLEELRYNGGRLRKV